MPGLEVHTLNPDIRPAELADALFTRAGKIATAGAAAEQASLAPETSGAFFIPTESPAFSVTGDYMPSIQTAQAAFESLQESSLIGDLMKRARLSKLTGCIMTGYSRDYKGYAKTGIKAVKELGLGTTSRQAHRVVHFARYAEKTGKLPTEEELGQQVDHICRNPACIYHTRLIDGEENNALMAEARRIEPAIAAGQMMYATDLLYEHPWLQFALAEEGETPAKVISTRLGPFVLRLAHPEEFVVYGERVACEAFDSLKEPAKKPSSRKSRARRNAVKPLPGYTALFPPTKYRKRHLPDTREKYRIAEKLVA